MKKKMMKMFTAAYLVVLLSVPAYAKTDSNIQVGS